MAIVRPTLAVSFVIYFTFYTTPVLGEIEFVPPLPGHPIVIEGEEIRITCVAYDIFNVSVPANITFQKLINKYNDPEDINPGGGYTFEQKTELNGLRLIKTMIIKNMSEPLAGRYQCSAWRPSSKPQKARPATHGFSIVYIRRNDLPQLNYSSSVTAEFGQSVSLYCRLIHLNPQVSSNNVQLNKIAWFKNDILTGTELVRLDERLRNIELPMNDPSDAGKYTCRLFTTLGLEREYNISGVITVNVKTRFKPFAKNSVGDDGYLITLDDNEIIRTKEESVKFECAAEGNPISIVWRMTSKSGVEKVLDRSDSHYAFSDDKDRFKGFWLYIADTNYDDRGEYRCCIGNGTDQCQMFTLRVKDPLGWAWPLIGIAVMAVVLVALLLITNFVGGSGAAKAKIVRQTDLSYDFSNEGSGTGFIRLRNTGARTG